MSHETPDGAAPDLARELRDHAAWARGLARSLVRDDATADDVVQDTWVAAMEHPPDRDRPLRPWLSRVLRNFAFRSRRGDARRRAREEAAAPAERAVPSPAEVAERVETHRMLADLVARLDEPFRTTVYLRFHEGREPSAIARLQGIPPGTVRWRIHRALELLRKDLDDRHRGDRSAWMALLLPLTLPPAGPLPPPAPVPAPGNPLVPVATTLGAAAMASKTAAVAVTAALAVLLLGGIWAGGVFTAGERARRPAGEDARLTLPLPVPAEARGPATTPEGDATPPAPAPVPPAGDTAGPRVDPDPVPLHVTLRAVTPRGLPLPDARARVVRSGPESFTARADGEGRLSLPTPPEGRVSPVNLVVSAPGRASRAETTAALGRADRDIGDVVLEEGGGVHGVVVTFNGAPVEGALVGTLATDVDPSTLEDRRHWTSGLHEGAEVVRSDADGAFTLEGIPVGTARLVATAPGRLAAFSEPVAVAAGMNSGPLRLVIPDGVNRGSITGSVVDAGGRPVAGASVRYAYRTKGSSGTGSTATGPDGTFTLSTPQATPYSLAASPPDGTPGGDAVLINVDPGTTDAVLRLPEPRTLRVVAKTPAGVPVEEATVSVLLPEPAPSRQGGADVVAYRMESETAGEDDDGPPPPGPPPPPAGGPGAARGGNSLDIDIPSVPFRLSVEADGHDTGIFGPYDPATVGASVEVRLVPLPGVRGRVTGPAGPLAGAAVGLHEVYVDSLVTHNGFRVRSAPDPAALGTTGDDGGFNLTLRQAGRYVLRATVAGLAPAEAGPFDLDPAAGKDGIEAVLGSGGAIEGRVLTGGGPTAGLIVGYSRGDGFAATVRADGEGRFLLKRLTPGPWEVRLVDEEITPAESSMTMTGAGGGRVPEVPSNVTVSEGVTTRFDLDLSPGSRVEVMGRVLVDGAPGTGSVWIAPADAFSFDESAPHASLDAEGRFRVVAGGAGRARVVLRGPSPGAPQMLVYRDMDLARGANTWDLDFRTGALEGTLPAGHDMVGLLHRQGDGTVFLAPLQPGRDGTLHQKGLPAGPGSLIAPEGDRPDPDPTRWPVLREVAIPEGGTAKVE